MGHWWLVTWNTYGTWLPGDPRGFQTWRGNEYVPPPRRYARPGESVYDPRKYASRHAAARAMTEEPVRLTLAQQRVALPAIVKDIAELPIMPAIMALGPDHVHLLAKFGSLKIRPTVGRLKSMATRAIKDSDPKFNPKRTWAKECHERRLDDEPAYRTAFAYVERHADQGFLIHTWPPKPTAPPSR
jgi:hypothetical protein